MESVLIVFLIVGPALVALFSFVHGAYVLTRQKPLPRKRTWLGAGLLVLGFCILGCYGLVIRGLSKSRNVPTETR